MRESAKGQAVECCTQDHMTSNEDSCRMMDGLESMLSLRKEIMANRYIRYHEVPDRKYFKFCTFIILTCLVYV